jgi:hypothetical protein
MPSREYVQHVVNTYIDAWENQSPDLIVTIFTPAATYHERVLGEPIPNRDAIREYWVEKVVKAQANIKCRPLSIYTDVNSDTAIVEWVAEFDDVAQGVRKRMKEIAVLDFEWTPDRGYLISALREYWASEPVGALATSNGEG